MLARERRRLLEPGEPGGEARARRHDRLAGHAADARGERAARAHLGATSPFRGRSASHSSAAAGRAVRFRPARGARLRVSAGSGAPPRRARELELERSAACERGGRRAAFGERVERRGPLVARRAVPERARQHGGEPGAGRRVGAAGAPQRRARGGFRPAGPSSSAKRSSVDRRLVRGVSLARARAAAPSDRRLRRAQRPHDKMLAAASRALGGALERRRRAWRVAARAPEHEARFEAQRGGERLSSVGTLPRSRAAPAAALLALPSRARAPASATATTGSAGRRRSRACRAARARRGAPSARARASAAARRSARATRRPARRAPARAADPRLLRRVPAGGGSVGAAALCGSIEQRTRRAHDRAKLRRASRRWPRTPVRVRDAIAAQRAGAHELEPEARLLVGERALR